MATLFPENELKQAWTFFTMGSGTLNLEEYLEALKNVGVVYNRAELKAREENDKKQYNLDDFLKDYHEQMKKLTKDELLKVFQEFDPESTGIMAYDVLHRALITYGERLTKEEADRFMQMCKLKPDQPIKYHDLLDEIVKIGN